MFQHNLPHGKSQAMQRLGLLAIGILFGLIVVPTRATEVAVKTSAAEDAPLNSYFDAYLRQAFQLEPLMATRLGNHDFDDQLDDLSSKARDSRLALLKSTRRELPNRVNRETLSSDGKIDYDIFQRHLDASIWLTETFHPFEDDPRIYGDYLSESVYLLLTQSSLPNEINQKNALARMEQIPGVVEEARRSLKNPPRVKTETAIRQTEGAIAFYEKDLFDLIGESPERAAFADKARPIVAALKSHLAFLKNEILPRSTENWRIGPELYEKKLDYELDSGIGADEVLAEAEREAVRVENEMAVFARQLWSQLFPGRPLPPDDVQGRRELIRQVLDEVAKDHGSNETLVEDVRATVAGIKTFIRDQRILTLPEPDHCRIVEMPEFLRGNSVAYLNPAPPLDARGSSEFAVSPAPSDWTPDRVESLLREYNRPMLQILTIHEAYPGHYVQLEYSNRCPSPIRRVLSSGIFAEGWAVYTEQMMLDQGFGEGSIPLRLQQLKFYLRAVVNAILDHKMHAGSMTDDEAMELLMGRAFQTEGEAVGKIIRAKQSSCQLSTYFIGRMAFYRLRQTLQREQGETFDLSRFHEAVLSHGTIPVKYLPELVRKSLSIEKPVQRQRSAEGGRGR
jgi:uncharacterized protein (DUF885 family)